MGSHPFPFMPGSRACRFLILASVWLGLLQGCGVRDVQAFYAAYGDDQALESLYYDVDIPTHDGVRLRATVYQPALEPGEKAPLIVHTHGFGAFRAPRPLSLYGQFVISGQAALAAWKQGYWVISYDQRGFGSSGGDVMLMHPDYEVRDLSSVIDWADTNLPRLRRDQDADLLVGTVGESYGGAVQILASMQDARLDALVPIATWYDLEQVLAPGGQVKTAWSSLLMTLGGLGSGLDFGMAMERDYLALLSGRMNARVSADLAQRSPAGYCESGQSVQADALFVQGFRDTLMPVNEGYRNWECALNGGRDARLLAIQDGHILMWPMQAWSGMPMFNTQERLSCGDRQFDMIDLIVGWWNEKLKGELPEENLRAPRLCAAWSDEAGVELQALTSGGEVFSVPDTEVWLVQSGLLEFLFEPLDWLWGEAIGWMKDPVPVEEQTTTGGWFRPAFVPLLSVAETAGLLGTPRLNLALETEADNGTLFVALGVRQPGSSYIRVLGDQYTSLTGRGVYQRDMPAVAYQLQPGETLGLVVQGFTGQYFLNAKGWFHAGYVSGDVQLPLLKTGEL